MLTRWKNYFCQLLNVHGPGGIMQTEIHTAENSAAEFAIALRMLKRCKATASDQIPAELFLVRGGGQCILRYTDLLC
jgi:hypothetical protein